MRDHLEARALARAKVRARRKRAATIRRRTFWFSVSVFGVAWIVIFGQLVGGHDPALARKRVAATEPRVQATPVRRPRSEPRPHHRRHHHRHHRAAPAATTTAAAPPPPTPVTTQQS